MRQINSGSGLDHAVGEGKVTQGFREVQGDAGQTLVGDEQIGAPAQVKDRPALSLGRVQDGGSFIGGAGRQQVLSRSADAPGGMGGQRVLEGGSGQYLSQFGGVIGFQFLVSSDNFNFEAIKSNFLIYGRELGKSM
jgi:hypothetical protein